MSSPEVELFIECYKIVQSENIPVYPFLPSESEYPFVFLGDTNTFEERFIKFKRTGRITQSVHLYHDDVNDVGTVMDLADKLKMKFKILYQSKNYSFIITSTGLNTRNLIDMSTSKPLRHYVIECEYKFS